MKDNYRAGNYRIGLSRVIPSSRKKERKIILCFLFIYKFPSVGIFLGEGCLPDPFPKDLRDLVMVIGTIHRTSYGQFSLGTIYI